MRHALTIVACILLVALPAAQSGLRARLVVGEGLNEPFAVDFDAAGRMFIAEMGGNRVSVWDRSRLTPLSTPFTGPHHLLNGPDNFIYVADTWSNVVRRVDPSTGAVTRFAGTGQKGFSGDGGPALDAQFGAVFAIAIHAGMLYIADLDNRRIRSVNLSTGIVGTVAGNGEKGVPKDGADAKAQPLVDPRAVAVDATGQIYICERGGHALRVVDGRGRIQTVAGTGEPGFGGDGGPALKATMSGPKHISIDTDGSVLITDTENHVIRRYRPGSGTVERVAGTGTQGAARPRWPARPAAAEPPARRLSVQGRALHLGQREPQGHRNRLTGLPSGPTPASLRSRCGQSLCNRIGSGRAQQPGWRSAPNSPREMPMRINVRRAVDGDLPALGRMGAALMRVHFAFDPLRFMDPGVDPESGYAWFLGTSSTTTRSRSSSPNWTASQSAMPTRVSSPNRGRNFARPPASCTTSS